MRLTEYRMATRNHMRRPSGPYISTTGGVFSRSRSCPIRHNSPGKPKVWSPCACVKKILAILLGRTAEERCTCSYERQRKKTNNVSRYIASSGKCKIDQLVCIRRSKKRIAIVRKSNLKSASDWCQHRFFVTCA
jgi:hypothetical protein